MVNKRVGDPSLPYSPEPQRDEEEKIDPEKFKKILKIDESDEAQKRQKRRLKKAEEEGEEERRSRRCCTSSYKRLFQN